MFSVCLTRGKMHDKISLKPDVHYWIPQDPHFFQPHWNPCYHYCWFISLWCRIKSFMGTAGDWKGIILSGPSGSAARSPQCKGKDGDFPGLWVKYVPLLGWWRNIRSHCGLGSIGLSSHSNHSDYIMDSLVTSQHGARSQHWHWSSTAP